MDGQAVMVAHQRGHNAMAKGRAVNAASESRTMMQRAWIVLALACWGVVAPFMEYMVYYADPLDERPIFLIVLAVPVVVPIMLWARRWIEGR